MHAFTKGIFDMLAAIDEADIHAYADMLGKYAVCDENEAAHRNTEEGRRNALVNLKRQQFLGVYRRDGITDAVRLLYCETDLLSTLSAEVEYWEMVRSFGKGKNQKMAEDRRKACKAEYLRIKAENPRWRKGAIWEKVAENIGGSAKYLQETIKIPEA